MTDAGDPEIQRAAAILRAGGLVAFPTETVYGLGAAARDPRALARLYAVKGRPGRPPGDRAPRLGRGPRRPGRPRSRPRPLALADRFWPGPLTLVLRRGPGVPDAVTGGRDTVGLRVPDQPVALALLRGVRRRHRGAERQPLRRGLARRPPRTCARASATTST